MNPILYKGNILATQISLIGLLHQITFSVTHSVQEPLLLYEFLLCTLGKAFLSIIIIMQTN